MEQDLPVFTPRETVGELDRYVVGQHKAKRAVAIALRNRWRRQQVAPELRDEVVPKNIILIGPTGVGKTEIARRLAKLAQAPFIKVEASKFTEVGYVGRDVESMVRDLTELAIGMVKVEEAERVQAGAARHAEDRLLDLLIAAQSAAPTAVYTVGPEGAAKPPPEANREALRKQLRKGELDEREVEMEQAAGAPFKGLEIFGGAGLDDMMSQIQDAFSKIPGMGGKGAPGMPGMPGVPGAQPPKRKRTKVPEALKQLVAEEADKLVDMERVVQTALDRVQQSGIIFLDEIDKIALSSGRGSTGQGPDVSRGGVQRDLLPIVEGSTVNTKHGPVKTDHILFIAAGAFHETKVSDLIPELQGRFPIRVELEALNRADFLQILTEPKNSLVRQYEALLATEGVTLTFSPEALEAIAEVAFEANTRMENIGARRLHTVLETVIEELSFKAPELRGQTLVVDAALVRQKLGGVLEDEDLSRYIL